MSASPRPSVGGAASSHSGPRALRCTVSGALGLTALFFSGVAQGQVSRNEAAADQLFRDGEHLFAQGKVAEACAKFEESNKLDPAPGTLNNLAVCHEREGKTATAWHEWIALADLAHGAQKPEREKEAQEHAASLEKKLLRVQIVLPAGVRASTVSLDGSVLDTASLTSPLAVDPGPHTFEVLTDSGKRSQSSVMVPPDSPTPIAVRFDSLALPATASSVQPVRAPARASGDSNRTASFVLFGVGAAGLAAGSVFGLLAIGAKDNTPNDCRVHRRHDLRCDGRGRPRRGCGGSVLPSAA